MDPVGLLAAAIAVLVYPGGAFLAVTAAGIGLAERRRPSSRWTPAAAGAMVMAVATAGQAALPGAPAGHLPSETAAPASLVGALVTLSAAAVLAGPAGWPPARLVAAVCAPLGALAVAAAAATQDLTTLGHLSDPLLLPARVLAAVALAAGVRVVTGDASPPPVTWLVTAAAAVLAGTLALPPPLLDLPAVVGAVVVALGAAAFAGMTALLRRMGGAWMPALLTAGASLAATGLALAAGH